jgi:hypothetical protein
LRQSRSHAQTDPGREPASATTSGRSLLSRSSSV